MNELLNFFELSFFSHVELCETYFNKIHKIYTVYQIKIISDHYSNYIFFVAFLGAKSWYKLVYLVIWKSEYMLHQDGCWAVIVLPKLQYK